MELKVQVKQAGKRQNKITTERLKLEKKPETVGELLQLSVKASRLAFLERMKGTRSEDQELYSQLILSEERLEEKAASGKVGFGRITNEKTVSEEKAVETARQAFEDGIIALFIDNVRYEEFDTPLSLTGDETVTFVKLTMLAGRMW